MFTYSSVAFVWAVPVISMFRIRKAPKPFSCVPSILDSSRTPTVPGALLRGSGTLRCEGGAARPPAPCLREPRLERCSDAQGHSAGSWWARLETAPRQAYRCGRQVAELLCRR